MRIWILALGICLAPLATSCKPGSTEVTGLLLFPSDLGPPEDSISASGTVRGPGGVGVQGIGVFLRYDSIPRTYGRDTVFTDPQGHYSTGWIWVYSVPCPGAYSLVFFDDSIQQGTELSNCGKHTINITWNQGG